MKPKLLVESDKYLKQVFQGTVLYLCKFFSHTGLSLQWGSDTWTSGLAGVLASLISFQQHCVWNTMLSPTCRTMTTLLTKRKHSFCSHLLTPRSYLSLCPSIQVSWIWCSEQSSLCLCCDKDSLTVPSQFSWTSQRFFCFVNKIFAVYSNFFF